MEIRYDYCTGTSRLVYKCRKCGEIFYYEYDDTTEEWLGKRLLKEAHEVELHKCAGSKDDLKYKGIADLIGGEWVGG